MGRKKLDKAEARRIGSLGAKAGWAKLSKEERSAKAKAIRKGKNVVK